MKIPIPVISLFTILTAAISSAQEGTFTVATGLVTPRDDTGMYLRTAAGQVEINWTPQTQVALEVDTSQLGNIADNLLSYKVPESEEIIEFPLPSGGVSAMLNPNASNWTEMLGLYDAVKHLPLGGMRFYFGIDPGAGQAASAADKRFIGRWDPQKNPHQITIQGNPVSLTTHEDEVDYVLIFGEFTTADCKPFIHRATVIGSKVGNVINAQEIYLRPLGDQVAKDDPDLPRYLFIGDSISGNYEAGLRKTLAGKFNIHHPPTNCGASQRGRENILEWVGAYEKPGRQWDVISFNHGHWDASQKKADYQENLEEIIVTLKKTGAKLVWVTTCPIPHGRGIHGDELPKRHASVAKSGIIERFYNPWAAEVMARHPEITICDQMQWVKNNPNGIFTEWWKGTDLHYEGEMADSLGKLLGEHIEKVTSPSTELQ